MNHTVEIRRHGNLARLTLLALPLRVEPDPYDRTEWVIVEPNSRVVCWVRGLRSEADQLVAAANRAPAYDAMLAALYECEAYLTDREDVVDGSYGEPAPNREMSLLIEVSAAIKAAEGVKPL